MLLIHVKRASLDGLVISGLLGTSIWRFSGYVCMETLWGMQNLLQSLSFLSGPRAPQDLPGGTGGLSWSQQQLQMENTARMGVFSCKVIKNNVKYIKKKKSNSSIHFL